MKKSELVKLLQGVSKENIETAILHAGLTLDANFFNEKEARAIIGELVKIKVDYRPFLNVYIDNNGALMPAKIKEVFYSPKTNIEELARRFVDFMSQKLAFMAGSGALGPECIATMFCVPESDILIAIRKAGLPERSSCYGYGADEIKAIRENLLESGWNPAESIKAALKILEIGSASFRMRFTLADMIDIFKAPEASVLKAIQQANLPVDAPFYRNDDFDLIRSKLVNY